MVKNIVNNICALQSKWYSSVYDYLKQGKRGYIMASIVKSKTRAGIRYSIQLSAGENKARPTIALGKVTRKQADVAKTNVENLIACRKTDGVMRPTVTDWLNSLPDGLRKRLETLGMIELGNSGQSFTVAEWIGRYIDGRPDVKEATKRKWRDVETKLAAFFRGQYINEITVGQAKDFRVYLQSQVGLAENTLRRHIGIARQFFNAAVDAELIKKNPFRDQPLSIRANESRFFYITLEMARKVLDVCPDAQWRLVFGLARFGGLRCPSEVLRLKWQDVDFANDRFTVHASKTEHHADGGIRTVPMFPELKPLFQGAFDEAPTGAVYCIDRYKGKWSNLGVHMARIVKRAKLEPWPKLFQNCRSTRETELFKMTGGNVKAVCSWIGNSPAVAMQHYAQVTEADLQEAAKMTVLDDAEKTVQKSVLTTAEQSRIESHESNMDGEISPCYCETNDNYATPCEGVQKGEKWAIQDSNL